MEYKTDSEVKRAEVCDMYDAKSFHVRYLDSIEDLEKITELMKQNDWESAEGITSTLRGTKCAAMFSLD